jgi:hypothetical protein
MENRSTKLVRLKPPSTAYVLPELILVLNSQGGGVLVTSFTKDAIDIWFWSRPNVPENIQKESPDKSTWGKPSASWPTKTCNIEKYFGDQ